MKIRLFFSIAVLLLLVSSCDEEIHKTDCNAPVQATVRDLTGLDGCGFVFELQDGTRLEPMRLMYCGTPPLPKEITEDPLYNFEFEDGKKVKIGYEECDDCGSICMAGTIVKITCIEEDQSPPTTDGQ
jgi:hypothetical protein